MRLRSASIVLLILTVGVLAAGPAWSRGSARPTLVLHGRACDVQGVPISGAKITATSKKDISAKTNSAGEYTLELPLVTVEELAKKKYKTTIWCEATGWHFRMPSSGFTLGLELELVTGQDTVLRCVARSNDVRFAAEAARAISDPANPVTVPVTFLGEPGEIIGRPPDPELDQVAQMALPSVAAHAEPTVASKIATITQLATTAALPTPTASSAAVAAPSAATTSGGQDSSRASAAAGSAIDSTASRVFEPIATSAKTPKPASTALDPIPGAPPPPVVTPPVRARAADRDAEEARKREERRAHAEARLIELQRQILARNEEAKRSEAEAQAEKERKERERGAKKKSKKPPSGGAITSSVRDAPPVEGQLAEAPDAKSSPGASKPDVKITPAPDGAESRTRAAPLVIRGPGVRTTPPKPAADSCGCRIRGTVEVESHNALSTRVRVAVGLSWEPAMADTVELFMGSPRAFDLRPAPCGSQTLRVMALSGGRFTVRSSEPISDFDCKGARQFRLILSPH
jgi:hypothetical protein